MRVLGDCFDINLRWKDIMELWEFLYYISSTDIQHAKKSPINALFNISFLIIFLLLNLFPGVWRQEKPC